MVEITLLGGVSVEVDGVTLTGEAAQRRRVALLALLASVSPRPVSRDRLIGWLWPDNDVDSARHLLSSALYVLRRALGADALPASSEDVALNAAVVHCDVAEFRQAVAAADTERALTLYGGDFMDGFFVNDAGDFTQWVDAERAELKRLYGTCLERAAGLRSEVGDLMGAAEAWRRRAALDPLDARVALGLMRALVAANQRAAAIKQARVHATLLEQELGAAPDAAVEAFAAELRRAPAGTPANASTTAVPETAVVPTAGTAVIAAAPIAAAAAVLVPAGPAALGITAPAFAGVATATAARAPDAPDLEMAPDPIDAVHIDAPPSRAPPRARRPRAPLWRQGLPIGVLALALSVPWLLREREIVIAVRPFESDDSILAKQGVGLSEDVLMQLPRISGVNTVTWDVAVGTVGLNSREANLLTGSHYLLTMRLHRDRGQLHGVPALADTTGVNQLAGELRGADEADLREQLLAGIADRLGRKLSPRSHSAIAADTANPAARAFYYTGRTAWKKRTRASLTAALAQFDSATTIAPQYARAWGALAETQALLGSYDYAALRPDDAFPRAEVAARRALELDPTLAAAHSALGLVLTYYRRDWEAAEAEFENALERGGDLATAHEWYALLLAARGRLVEARTHSVLAVDEEPDSPIPLVQRAHILYYSRRYDEARADLRLALEYDSAFARAHLLGAVIDLVTNREQHALARLTGLRQLTGDTEPVVIALLGYAQARTGQRQAALEQLAWLEQARTRQWIPPELVALVHFALGDRANAMTELERAYHEKSSGLVFIQVEPLMDELHGEPRFQKLLQLMHGN